MIRHAEKFAIIIHSKVNLRIIEHDSPLRRGNACASAPFRGFDQLNTIDMDCAAPKAIAKKRLMPYARRISSTLIARTGASSGPLLQ
jgi:hypothetical protein